MGWSVERDFGQHYAGKRCLTGEKTGAMIFCMANTFVQKMQPKDRRQILTGGEVAQICSGMDKQRRVVMPF